MRMSTEAFPPPGWRLGHSLPTTIGRSDPGQDSMEINMQASERVSSAELSAFHVAYSRQSDDLAK